MPSRQMMVGLKSQNIGVLCTSVCVAEYDDELAFHLETFCFPGRIRKAA